MRKRKSKGTRERDTQRERERERKLQIGRKKEKVGTRVKERTNIKSNNRTHLELLVVRACRHAITFAVLQDGKSSINVLDLDSCASNHVTYQSNFV